jgi:hypothetical protein
MDSDAMATTAIMANSRFGATDGADLRRWNQSARARAHVAIHALPWQNTMIWCIKSPIRAKFTAGRRVRRGARRTGVNHCLQPTASSFKCVLAFWSKGGSSDHLAVVANARTATIASLPMGAREAAVSCLHARVW